MSNDSAPPNEYVAPPRWATPEATPAARTPPAAAVQGPFAPPPEPFPIGPEPPAPPTNRWAIVGFISSLFGLFPIGIGAGVVALTQLRHRQEQGKGLAIAGIVISGAVALLAVGAAVASLAMVAFVGPWAFDEFAGNPSQGRADELGALDVGDCFDSAAGEAVAATDCDEPHDGELYLREPLGGLWGVEFPAYDEVGWAADEQCWDAFEGYVGEEYENSQFDYFVYAPDQESWAQGDRTIACVISLYGDEIEGAARGSGR